MLKLKKTNDQTGGNRMLISITVLGSVGPIRFVVYEEELVASVIDRVLRSYAREGRRPVLGSDINGFCLYCAYTGLDHALIPWETIGSYGRVRNFTLCRKPETEKVVEAVFPGRSSIVDNITGSWKSWFSKSSNVVNISSH